jgi:hypothetical protein
VVTSGSGQVHFRFGQRLVICLQQKVGVNTYVDYRVRKKKRDS